MKGHQGLLEGVGVIRGIGGRRGCQGVLGGL